MDISVILPVFNGAHCLAEAVETLRRFMDVHFERYEIIIVNDGSTDLTPQIVKQYSGKVKTISLEKNSGKYAALKAGIRAAQGKCKIFTDVDLPYDLSAIPYIWELVANKGMHVVIGDRSLRNSEYKTQTTFVRRVFHLILRTLIRLLFLSQIFDSQCGLKGFQGEIGDELFSLMFETGFAGDVELLYIALKHNLSIRRIPVRARRHAPSTVNIAGASMGILKRILLLTLFWRMGYYRSPLLQRLGSQAYWDENELQ